ncbi:hypothetical protein [Embleya hyalina]|uniref:Uncharacterized protein n=1 Tax=Embleya hyalina TaxID=516124 RepID=A0A401Z504_9ACTN|nr:hypothetical protein [Embleya hyalina]GCE01906.1 hypothetical protein EHYA_09681 [Embleya hyalina]
MASTASRPASGTPPAASTPTRARRPPRRFAPASVSEAARRSAYAFLALPLGLIGIVLTLGGRSSRAGRLQLAAARRFLAPRTGGDHHIGATNDRAAAPGAVRILRHAILDTALGVPTLVLAAYAYGNTIRNLTYPIWYGHTDYHDAWGGPTLAGVWAVHTIGALAFFAVCLCLIQGLTNLRAAGARRTFRSEDGA